MSWTNSDTIKRHLEAFTVDALEVQFHPVRLVAGESHQLPHAPLASGSVLVQAMLSAAPGGPSSVALSGTAKAGLGSGPVAPGSVVLAKSVVLDSRFIEGVDYTVDEQNGTVNRIEGGSISDGDVVKAWWLSLTTFDENVDYILDLTAGTLKTVPGGNLPSPANLLVSYATSAAGASDTLIGQAIYEAEAKIADRLKDDYTTSSKEDGLAIGATELTLSILCDDLAARALTGIGDASADDRAHQFQLLAKRFEERATTTLSRFLRLPLPSSPTRQSATAGGSGW